jgi:hypothetical protein
MTKATLTLLLAFVLSTASLATPSSDQQPTSATTHDAHAAHDALEHAVVAPPDGERWPTDEPLRTGMSRIQSAVEQSTVTPLSRERSLALARTIEQNVTYVIENCKLPTKADAALHVLLARILAATNQLKNDDPSSDAAVAQIRSALQDYRDAFDHSPVSPNGR